MLFPDGRHVEPWRGRVTPTYGSKEEGIPARWSACKIQEGVRYLETINCIAGGVLESSMRILVICDHSMYVGCG